MRRPTSRLLLAPVVPLLLVGGCGYPSTVSASTLEERVQEAATGEGVEDYLIDCPGDLKAVVNDSADCLVEDAEGSVTGVRFITTEVDGDDLSYETLVFLGAAEVQKRLADELGTEDVGVKKVMCDDVLVATPGSTLTCRGLTEAGAVPVQVTTTEVDGLQVSFDWDVVSGELVEGEDFEGTEVGGGQVEGGQAG
ncbi:DUF4333 domain-containing protein [Nocardioides campestrisoli]|uniref:DUF4333 domain-containing protein n=1 Tax=Nocardioides campestrisoli TaxID=2736757 RepID=UPI0015E68F76|nr:DUF4333 domain-containing protein [Nocardioides campestrisoli]